MGRQAAFASAALTGLLLAACAGSFGQSGASLPNAADDVQTVSDAADSLVAHHGSASANAKSAIGVTDAFGSVVRQVSDDERFLSGFSRRPSTDALVLQAGVVRTSALLTPPGAARVYSLSQLVMRGSAGDASAYCQSSAGFSLKGIPSLGESFGWQSGVYAGGTRTTEGRGYATWSATGTGETVQAPIGALSIVRSGAPACPMMTPTFSLDGAKTADAFSIPFTLTYRNGMLRDVSVGGASFSNGESLDIGTSPQRNPTITGVITAGKSELASFRLDRSGRGTLTIVSTGAQYAISDWIVAGV